MRFLSEHDANGWLAQKFGAADIRAFRSELGEPTRYPLPVDSGKKTFVARSLTRTIQPDPESLLWFTEWSVWPSSENLNLFYGYRRSLGEQRPLIEVPAQAFSPTDIADVECLLDIALYFFWDAWIIEGSRGLVIHASHDEYVDIYSRDRNRLGVIESILSSPATT